MAHAFRLVFERKEDEALTAFQKALAAVDTELVRGEIKRSQARKGRDATAERTAQDIQTVLTSGNAADAAELAREALQQFGNSDAASSLTNLKRQVDALRATQFEENARKKNILDELARALQEKNLRVTVLADDQAVASGADVSGSEG